MERYNCTLGRYYNSEPVVNSRMEKIKKSKILRSLRRGFCGSDDEDICKFSGNKETDIYRTFIGNILSVTYGYFSVSAKLQLQMSFGKDARPSSSRLGAVDSECKSTEIFTRHGRLVQKCCMGTAANIPRRNVRSSNIEFLDKYLGH